MKPAIARKPEIAAPRDKRYGVAQLKRDFINTDLRFLMTKTLFVSYSHKDEKHKDYVVSHLGVAEKQGLLKTWDDRRIKGGRDWQAEIDAALDQADIGVLLISRHFLTSDFIMDHEVQTMLQRHADHDVIIYPILISDCTWQSVGWLKAINLRPKDAVPLNSFGEAERDQVMANIASEIAQRLHPGEEPAITRRSDVPRQQQPSTNGGFLTWWQGASVTARATVLGTVFAGLALAWSVMSGFTGGDQINADCSAVNTGSVEGSEINVDC